MESFNLPFATKTQQRYACSNCWGELELVRDLSDRTKYFVLCRKCQEETRGYVSQYYVNRRRGESEGDKVNVTHLLIKLKILPNPLEGMSRQDIIKSLGF